MGSTRDFAHPHRRFVPCSVSAGSGTKHIYGVTPAAPLAGAAGVVEDAQIHGPGMQIDAAVESVRLVVESHHGTPMGPGVGARLVVGRCTLPENPTFGPARKRRARIPWAGFPAHPKEAMNSIQSLQPTAAAMLAKRGSCRSARPPRQVNGIVQQKSPRPIALE